MGNVDVILRGGDLRDYGVIEVLATMHSNRITGVMKLRGEGTAASIFTMEGDIIAAESDADSQRLGVRLVRKGVISASQLDKALRKVTETSSLGEVLIQEGHTTQDQLDQALSAQFEDILFSSFLIHDGRYEVQVLDAVFADNMQLLFDTADLLNEGRKLRDDLSPLVAALSGGDRGLAKGSAAGKVLLTSEQKAMVELAQEHRLLEQILDHSRLDRIPTLRLLTQLLERHVLALAKIQGGNVERPGFRLSQRGRDPTAGLFTTEDSVLDKVDLSNIVHFTVATDIPLTGVVETLGVEDMDERDGELESQQTVYMERADSSRGDDLTDVEDADDESDELVFTEDGQVSEEVEATGEMPVERLEQPLSAPPRASRRPGRRVGLTPAQKQTLRRRVQVYNRMYQTLFAHACQHARRADVQARFQSFFSSGVSQHPELFVGVEFRTDGTLNPDRVLRNLEDHSFESPFETFDLTLHEVARYLLSDASALIEDQDAEARLKEAVLEIRKQLFRKGANVPSLG